MSYVKKENYITIQGWMVSDLGLSGNSLLVYAIIYGFSQDNGSYFTGSLQYLADWCNATKRGIMKNLEELISAGLIDKREYVKNNQKYCEYSCRPMELCSIGGGEQSSLGGEQSSIGGGEQSSLNNINTNNTNNINNKYILSKDNISATGNCESHMYSKEDFLQPRNRRQAQKKKSLYDQCAEENTLYTQDVLLHTLLDKYLALRLAMKDKPLYGVNQWKGILNKLDAIIKDNPGMSYEDVVNQSIERGYASFFPVSRGTYNRKANNFSEFGEVSCSKADEGDDADVEF